MSMTSAPLARKYSAAARNCSGVSSGGVVDLGQDLDGVGAVVQSCLPLPEVAGDLTKIFGSLLNREVEALAQERRYRPRRGQG